MGIFVSDLGSGGGGTFFNWSFSELIFFFLFNISRKKNSKISKVNQQSVLNLLYLIFYHFPKNLDRTITFNSVTLKNPQTEPHFFSTQQIIFRVGG